MKKLFFVVASFILITGTSLAQDLNLDVVEKRDTKRDISNEYFMMKDGKMIQVKDGKEIALQNQIRLKNGAVLNPDGIYKIKNKDKKLRNGECIDMDGKQYRNREKFEQRMQKMNKEKVKPEGPNKEKNKEKKKDEKSKY